MDPQQTPPPPPQNPADQPYMPPVDTGAYGTMPPGAQPSPNGGPNPVQNPLASPAAPAAFADPLAGATTQPSVAEPTEITTTISHEAAPAYSAAAPNGVLGGGSGSLPGASDFSQRGAQPAFQPPRPSYPSYGVPDAPQSVPGMNPDLPGQNMSPVAGMPGVGVQPAPPFGAPPQTPGTGMPGSMPLPPSQMGPAGAPGQIADGVSPSMVTPPHAPAGPVPLINGHNQRREPKAAFLAVIGVVVLGLAILIAYLVSRGK